MRVTSRHSTNGGLADGAGWWYGICMKRPLRGDVPGGLVSCDRARHRAARDLRRQPDNEHFIELIDEMAERFGSGIYAYALMGNHYHCRGRCFGRLRVTNVMGTGSL